ncbi:cation:proton antiporter subunit C [Sedimentitalea sp. JM2-8]|uniref:Cation:proton antiporter subunit C n=1 Tax=Sedimentitalea xiamensis TaxID=3050037 RepID=A0ABT7FII4_9RHOB|nr:cation:proton antiporter subunit C [Sedimentitalea xiamensis]MDK3074893.1 cation:proton antiporter subunit C [Sedimentitalea xiamensis]
MVEEAVRDWEFFLGHMNYWLFIVLMMTGFYIVVAKGNLVKKIVGLNIFQTSVFMFYISIGKVEGGTAPIFPVDMNIDPAVVYSNPLPHVLILTAIVVGVATTSLGLALIVRIREEYGSIEEDEILKIEKEIALQEIRLHSEVMGERG